MTGQEPLRKPEVKSGDLNHSFILVTRRPLCTTYK